MPTFIEVHIQNLSQNRIKPDNFTKRHVFISDISGQRNRKQKVLDVVFHGKNCSVEQADSSFHTRLSIAAVRVNPHPLTVTATQFGPPLQWGIKALTLKSEPLMQIKKRGVAVC